MKTDLIANQYTDLLNMLKGCKDHAETLARAIEFVHNHLRSHPEESSIILEMATLCAQKHSDKLSMARLYYYKGWLSLDSDNYLGGIKDFQSSYNLFLKLDNKEWIIKTLSSLGFAKTGLGNAAEAFIDYHEALRVATEINDEKIIPQLLSNMGESYLALKQFEDALECFQKSILLEQFPPNRVVILDRIGYIYNLFDNAEKGIPYLNQGLILAEQEGFLALKVQILKSLGASYAKIGQASKAMKTLKEAIQLAQMNHVSKVEAEANLILGEILMKYGKLEDAIGHLERALNLAKTNNILVLKIDSLKSISEALQKKGKWKRALVFFKEYHSECQIFFNQETAKQIDKIKISEALREADLFKKMYHQLSVISQMGQEITSTLDLQKVVEIIYKKLNEVMDTSVLGLGFYNKDDQSLDYRFFIENGKWFPPFTSSVLDTDSFGAWCVNNKKEVIINDVNKDFGKYVGVLIPMASGDDQFTNSLIYMPLLISNQVIGILSIQSYQANAYNDYQIEIFRALASYVAIAVENAKLYEEVEIMATNDPLTNLSNRTHFNSLAEIELLKYQRTGEEFSIIMIDLDYFKRVNDTHGHDVGDIVLKEVAALFNEKVRRSDLFCRWGGEEFVILLPNTRLKQAAEFANRLKNELNGHKIKIDLSQTLTITASFGITIVSPDDTSIKNAIKRADLAVYEAKEKGRNTISIYGY